MKQQLLGIAVIAALTIGGVVQAAPMPNAQGQDHQPAASAQLSPAQRSAIVGRIVHTWGPFVQTVYNTAPAIWASRMASTFAAANDSNLQRAAEMKTFQGMVSALVGEQLSDAKVVDSLATRAQVLKSGPIPALLGDVTDDLVYTPIAPCRIVDTRNAGGPIVGGFTRSFMGYTAGDFAGQGGISGSNCGIPANPSALMMNVTAVTPTQAGWLTIYPYATTQPLASSLNYTAGSIVGNEIVAGMTLGSAAEQFTVFAQGTSNVVVDAVGYFMAPHQTPVNCTRAHNAVAIAAGASSSLDFIACPAGFTVTGGGCGNPDINTNLQITWSTESYATSGSTANSWFCQATNTGPNSETLDGDAICCVVPGR